MQYKYTGRAKELTYKGKTYAQPDIYDKTRHAGSFNDPIPGMDEKTALALVEHSSMHSFEVNGDDLLDKVTAPEQTSADVDTKKK